MRLAAERLEPLVLRQLRLPRVLLRRVRDWLEYLHHPRLVPWLRPSVALDDLPALLRLVTP